MQVLALVGPSGTGKSYCAQLVAHEYEADAILDDGLLIRGNQIMAGVSAKRQSTRVGAIKTALFTDAGQAQTVRDKLEELAPKRLLILATSEAMAHHIARNLNLPEPEKIVNIRDVASPVAIARARRSRQERGHHVVPAPTVEVKPRFSGTIIEPVRALWHRPKAHPDGRDHSLWVEQSIVRPTFTYLGHFYIANEALVSIAVHCVKLLGYRLERVNVTSRPDGVILTADLVVPYGVELPTAAREAQLQIHRQLEHMTALNVLAVNLTIKQLLPPGRNRHPSGSPGGGRKSSPGAARLR